MLKVRGMSIGKVLVTTNAMSVGLVLGEEIIPSAAFEVMLFNTLIIKRTAIDELLKDPECDEYLVMDVMEDYEIHLNEFAIKYGIDKYLGSDQNYKEFLESRFNLYEEEQRHLTDSDHIGGKLLYCFKEKPLCAVPIESRDLSQIMFLKIGLIEMIKFLESEVKRAWQNIDN